MTYKELLIQLQKLTREQLDTDVTIQDSDNEFYLGELKIPKTTLGVLDENHPVLQIIQENGNP